jgi:DNA-binding NarL/FixJ family response regulator
MDFVEAAGAAAPDDRTWARRVVEAATPVFAEIGPTDRVAMLSVRHPADCAQVEILWTESTANWAYGHKVTEDHRAIGRFSPKLLRSLYYPRTIIVKQSEICLAISADAGAFMAHFRRRYEVTDAVGMVLHPAPGLPVVLCAGYARSPAVPRHIRRLLTRVALHVEAGYRLRARRGSVRAVIRPDGRLLHYENGAPDRALLSAHARRVERARSRRHRDSPEALEIWQVLVDGRASLVEREDSGQRCYYVVDNPPARQPLRALAPEEVDTISFAARGLSAKSVAYGLGVSESAVSSRLSSAACKIGVATRIELVRLAAMLTNDPRASFQDSALTTAERDVLALLAQGLSNAEIARIRNRSVRTIANQVAGLLAKTGCDTRRGLVTQVL